MRFSIVTPVYNAAPYLRQMIDSVLSQSFSDWEMVMVDDCSTDCSADIMREASRLDGRIRVFSLDENSGSCFQPRRVAMEKSRGDFVVNIDADDYVEPDYLLKLDRRIRETGADIVYTNMVVIDGEEPPHKILPADDAFYSNVYTGKDLFRATLDKWELSQNGAATSRPLALKTLEHYDSLFGHYEKWGGHHDENLSRFDLFFAGKIAFADTDYFYRIVSDSITHQVSAKRFELLNADVNLAKFTEKHFGKESEEYGHAQAQLLHHTADFIRYLNRYTGISDRLKAEEITKKAFGSIDFNAVKGKVSPRYRLLFKAGYKAARLGLRIAPGK